MTAAEADDPGFTLDVLSRRRRRRARELPALLGRAVRLVHRAAPTELRVAVALAVAGGALAAGQLLLLRSMLARLTAPGATTATVAPWCAALVGVLGLAGVLGVWARERQRVLGELVVRHAQDLVTDAASTAELVAFQRPAFHNRLQRALANLSSRPVTVTNGIVTMAGALASAAGVAATLAALQPVLLLLVVGAGLPLWVAARALGRLSFGFDVGQTEADRRRSYLLGLLVLKDPAKEVRAFQTAPYLRRALAASWDERIATLRSLARRRVATGALARVVSSALVGVTLLALTSLVTTGRITLAEAGVAAGGAFVLAQALQQLAGSLGLLYESALFLEDAEAFVGHRSPTDATGSAPTDRPSTSAALPEPAAAPFRRLELVDVHFRYPGASHDALQGVSLAVDAGQLVALVGANGSGKSTLAKVLAQLYSPTAGAVRWNGEPVDGTGAAARRDEIAVLFQDFDRYLFSAAENIGLGRTDAIDDRRRVRAAAEQAGIHDRLARLDRGYDGLLGPEFFGGTDLSGGEWQRVALARTFFRDAPLVVLDEPTSALDPESEHELFERVRALWRGRAVVLVSHRFSNVTAADRIVVLHAGRIVEQGTHDELLAADGRYASMFRRQAAPYQLTTNGTTG